MSKFPLNSKNFKNEMEIEKTTTPVENCELQYCRY